MSCSCDNNPLILPVGATGPQGPQGEPGFGFEHFVGEEFGGGVIFHVYKDADGTEHGLVVSIVNQSTSSAYSNITNQSIGASTTWDGQTNTNLMAAQTSASTGAWKVANDYSYGGFTDWYLPSITELDLLRQNRFNVYKTFSTIIGATELITNNWYWSSTEDATDPSSAKAYGLNNSQQIDYLKSALYNVRAIRKY